MLKEMYGSDSEVRIFSLRQHLQLIKKGARTVNWFVMDNTYHDYEGSTNS